MVTPVCKSATILAFVGSKISFVSFCILFLSAMKGCLQVVENNYLDGKLFAIIAEEATESKGGPLY